MVGAPSTFSLTTMNWALHGFLLEFENTFVLGVFLVVTLVIWLRCVTNVVVARL